MTPEELLAELVRRDIRLRSVGSRLRVDAPQAGWDPAIRSIVLDHKPALLKLLAAQSAGASAGGEEGRSVWPILLMLLLFVVVAALAVGRVEPMKPQQRPPDPGTPEGYPPNAW